MEKLSEEEVRSLMRAINRRYGLDFTNYEINSLMRGLARLMMKHKMKNILELWSVVLKDEEFFKNSIDDLLVNLTELFRNPDAWIKIRDDVLKKIGKNSEIKVWHAGCSTGEEVYTMAIILDELRLIGKTKALATDLSSKALSAAIKGEYSLMVMKNYMKPFLKFYPGKELKDFFDFQSSFAVVKDKYRKHVEFDRHNLLHTMDKKFDIIFCRNVMIYFDQRLKVQVLNMFYNCLNPGGYLVIGYYDSLPPAELHKFKIYDAKTRIYIKE